MTGQKQPRKVSVSGYERVVRKTGKTVQVTAVKPYKRARPGKGS
jgi:hypothetical protein